jgi:hypothetical protein
VSMTVLSNTTTVCGYLRLADTGQFKRPTKWWCVLAEGKLRLYKFYGHTHEKKCVDMSRVVSIAVKRAGGDKPQEAWVNAGSAARQGAKVGAFDAVLSMVPIAIHSHTHSHLSHTSLAHTQLSLSHTPTHTHTLTHTPHTPLSRTRTALSLSVSHTHTHTLTHSHLSHASLAHSHTSLSASPRFAQA